MMRRVGLAAAPAGLPAYDVHLDPLALPQRVAIAQVQGHVGVVLALLEAVIKLSDPTLGAIAPLEDPTQGGHAFCTVVVRVT